MAPRSGGPGLSKTRALGLLERRTLTLLRSSDYRWRELFERADVMSEGACREESDGTTYYGSTSVLLPFASKGGGVPDELGPEVAALIASDPHARVRAVRMACLEAQVRSKVSRVRSDMAMTSAALETYRLDHGYYPRQTMPLHPIEVQYLHDQLGLISAYGIPTLLDMPTSLTVTPTPPPPSPSTPPRRC